VEIMSIAREAGSRTKIAVYAKQPDIDAVGACVGHKGTRIQNVLNEIGMERIDVVEFSEDSVQYIKNALSPAAVLDVYADADSRTALVVVDDSQLSLAIGKDGQNVRLAAKLTGWKIDIKNTEQYEQMKLVAEAEDAILAAEAAEEEQAAEPILDIDDMPMQIAEEPGEAAEESVLPEEKSPL
jgi:N utilization substance protein A